MNQEFIKYVYLYFNMLIEEYSFSINEEVVTDRDYWIKFSSASFTIEIVKYFRELYTSVSSANEPIKAINLSNLLGYIMNDDPNTPSENYFRKEKILQNVIANNCFIHHL
jgi:hypothetical protein